MLPLSIIQSILKIHIYIFNILSIVDNDSILIFYVERIQGNFYEYEAHLLWLIAHFRDVWIGLNAVLSELEPDSSKEMSNYTIFWSILWLWYYVASIFLRSFQSIWFWNCLITEKISKTNLNNKYDGRFYGFTQTPTQVTYDLLMYLIYACDSEL